MRILLFPGSYLPVPGGLQIAVHELACQFQSMGHEVLVLSNRYPRSLRKEELIDGIRLLRLPLVFPDRRYLRQARFDLALAAPFISRYSKRMFSRILSDFKPDILHVHFPHHQVPLLNVSSALPPVFVTFHGHDIERFAHDGRGGRTSRDLHQLKVMLARSAWVTACSPHLSRAVQEHCSEVLPGMSVVGDGISSVFSGNGEVHGHSRPYIFANGRLTKVKGFDLLLTAYAESSLSKSGIDLLLAGAGEDMEALKRFTAEMQLEDNVHFLGQRSQGEIAAMLRGCRFCVIPSRNEGFGMAALESLLCAKPVVATEVGGLKEVLVSFLKGRSPEEYSEEFAPVLFSDASVGSLRVALQTMAAEFYVRSMSLRNIDRNEYGWEPVARLYLEIFSRFVPGRRNGTTVC